MGDIRIAFDDRDEVVNWKGNPIYLDQSIKEGMTNCLYFTESLKTTYYD